LHVNKTVLLDLDGVMVTTPPWQSTILLIDQFSEFNPRCVECLNSILFHTSADILLTTSHRFNYTEQEWTEAFQRRGVNVNKISVLQFSAKSRLEEILFYSQTNKAENFLIIDDDKGLNALPIDLKDRLILTSPLIGLTSDLANQAIQLLK
jgi:hypothetical protein